MHNTLPRLACRRAMAIIAAVCLLFALAGCKAKSQNIYPAMADTVALSLEAYQALSKTDRLSAIDAMTDIVFNLREDLPLKPGKVDGLLMDGAQHPDYAAYDIGSAIAAFCTVTDTYAETYLHRDVQTYPPLNEAMALRINDLTGRPYGVGVPGMHVLINALDQLDLIEGDSQSAKYYAPMMALRIRAVVEDIAREEMENDYTSSGKISYTEAGGYLRELCRLLGLDFDAVYTQVSLLAAQQADDAAAIAAADAQLAKDLAEFDQTLAQLLVGQYESQNGWYLTLGDDGFYTLSAAEEPSLSIGGWQVKEGVLLLGDDEAAITEKGIYIRDIAAPFVFTAF